MTNPYAELMSGNLVTSLLIQFAKLKLEIDEEMLQMDRLIKKNEINLQLAATFPIVLGIALVFKAGASVARWLRQRRFRWQQQ